MSITTADRPTELLARTSTPALIASAMMLDAFTDLSAEQRLTRAWICDEIERRHPEVQPALDAWADSLEFDATPPSYVEALIAALPVSVLA